MAKKVNEFIGIPISDDLKLQSQPQNNSNYFQVFHSIFGQFSKTSIFFISRFRFKHTKGKNIFLECVL